MKRRERTERRGAKSSGKEARKPRTERRGAKGSGKEARKQTESREERGKRQW
jgi:hypothetical protein